MRVKMELLSDVIFGNGMSVPGAEDISVLCDEKGFPFYKCGTFKGIFREEMERYLGWTGKDAETINFELNRMLGEAGDSDAEDKIIFSDFTLSEYVKQEVLKELGDGSEEIVKDIMTNLRTFTSITEDGVAQEGSLRIARCVNQGLVFYSDVQCKEKDKNVILEVISLIKWIGSMRNRGFGKVRISIVEGDK